MKRALQLALFLLAGANTHAEGKEPVIWAKQAAVLHVGPEDVPCPTEPATLYAPDRRTAAKILCQRRGDISTYSVEVKTSDGKLSEAKLDEGAHELLWAPNSKAFFVNGGQSAYSGFFVTVYFVVPEHRLRKMTVTESAQRDMVASFPPCRAWNRNGEEECKQLSANPQYNMSGIRWTANSSAIDVFAEIPCSSSYGGIMCQARAYELRVGDGQIVRSYNASTIPVSWRRSMAWRVNVPSPAKYGPANVTYSYLPPVAGK